jgi:hypothetical protein
LRNGFSLVNSTPVGVKVFPILYAKLYSFCLFGRINGVNKDLQILWNQTCKYCLFSLWEVRGDKPFWVHLDVARAGSVCPSSTRWYRKALTHEVSNNLGGVYIYPYEFKVNGTANVPLMCDYFTNEVTVDESWTANVSPITAINKAGANRLYNVISSGGGLMNGGETYYVAVLICLVAGGVL